MKVGGTIIKYKARLVVTSFRQQKNIDYFETYLLVSRITFIRILIVIATFNKLEIH